MIKKLSPLFTEHKWLKIAALSIFILVLLVENVLSIMMTHHWQLANFIAFFLGNLFMFIAAGYIIFIYRSVKRVKSFDPDKLHRLYRWSLIILGLALLIIPFFFIVHVPYSHHDWDYFVIYRDTSLLDGRNFTHLPMTENERLYFLRYPNNQFFTIIYNVVFASITKVIPKAVALTLIAAICTSIAGVAGSLLVKKIADEKLAFLYNIVAFGFFPFYVYGALLYTDTASIPFVIVGLLFIVYAIKSEKLNKQIIWWICASLVIALGYYLKPTVAFTLIAATCFLVLNRKWKKLFLMLPIAAIIFVGMHEGVKTVIAQDPAFTQQTNDRYNLPLIHWVAMSFDPRNTSGGFNPAVLAYSESYTNKAEKQKADFQLLVNNLKKQGVPGVLLQLGRKIVYTWFNGDLRDFFYTYYHANPLVHNYFDWISSKYTEDNPSGWFLLNGAQTLYWIGIVFFMWYEIFLSIFKKWKTVWFILGLSMVGLTAFLLVWEANSRYLYNFAPIMLTLAILGLVDFLKSKKGGGDAVIN